MSNKDNKTVNLPKTSFPMKANLPSLEKSILQNKPWVSTSSDTKSKTIIHDGPPYANGDIHIGHAYNKTLKDILGRYLNLVNKEQSHYVCGWDCHGLPIELAAAKKQGSSISDLEVFRTYAKEQVEQQKEQFEKLGIIIEHKYETMSSSFEDEELKCFQELVKKGYVVHRNMPVHWCWNCETSLAESELEYQEVSDNSVYVLFPVKDKANLHFLIWTTTPWTLKGNRAIALNKKINYVVAELPTKQEVIVSSYFAVKNNLEVVNENINFDILKRNQYLNPFSDESKYEEVRTVFHADYVSEEVGTGFVHIAPSCGREDYVAFLKEYPNKSKDIDSYTDTKGLIDGVFFKKANKLFVEELKNNSFLWKEEKAEHKYPHCWRCHKPTIQRATKQVFLDYSSKKDLILSEAEKINFFPVKSKNRFMSFVLSRTEWCISRQRKWGVPIPEYYCNNCSISDFDLEVSSVEQWRNKEYQSKCSHCKSSIHTHKNDEILDVWFDSGLTYRTLENRKKSDWVVEGSDQHRGWFQSSHILSCLLEEQTCLTNIVSHGFVLDENGEKMSKSKGNVVYPLNVVNEHGIEIFRLWTLSQQVGDDIRYSNKTLDVLKTNYRKIRNTLKYLHGNLYDYNPETTLDYSDLQPLEELAILKNSFHTSFQKIEFNNFLHRLMNYLDELSTGYIDKSKTVLYESAANSVERRRIQTTYYYILNSLMEMIEVILPFTILELKEYIQKERMV